MSDQKSFDAAVEAGVIDAGQAEKLKALMAARAADATGEDADGAAAPTVDQENLRFVSSLKDVFVATGLVILFYGLSALAGDGAPALIALAAWGLAEIFTRRRRMALPSIVLSIAFLVAFFFCASQACAYFLPGGSETAWRAVSPQFRLVAASALLAAVVHEHRFKTPFDAVPIAFLIVLLLAGLVGQFFRPVEYRTPLLIMGFGVFVAAVKFDLSDPLRRTRRSDRAFWLHLLAAWLLADALFGGGGPAAQPPPSMSWIMPIVVFCLTFVGLLIDRRALIVSALLYQLVAVVGTPHGGAWFNLSICLSLLFAGGMAHLLTIGWRDLRRLIVPLIPLPAALIDRLPPVVAA